ncbi:MAG: hypothetical protein DRN01_07135, partial [Thermoplasmata archaeon]
YFYVDFTCCGWCYCKCNLTITVCFCALWYLVEYGGV